MTVSQKELVVLRLLAAADELYGLQMVEQSGGDLKRGTIYVTLGRMEDKGYLTSRADEPPPGAGGLPRRLYTLTPLGRRLLKKWSGALDRLMPEFGR